MKTLLAILHDEDRPELCLHTVWTVTGVREAWKIRNTYMVVGFFRPQGRKVPVYVEPDLHSAGSPDWVFRTA